MSELVSITVGFCGDLGYAALDACARSSNAISTEAQVVRLRAKEVVESAESSQALFGDKTAAISQLMTMANECAEPDWDGDNANGINSEAVTNAREFVRVMPSDLPLPEFAPEPDGSVSLDWIQSRHRLFSLSIGASNRLAYAWLDGSDKGHGVARFDRCEIPARILEGIRSIMNHGNASVRAA
jgi:hypothetical protein